MPRQMRCPRCSTINTVQDGAKPVCYTCGFGAPPGTELLPPPGADPGMEAPAFAQPGLAEAPPRQGMTGTTIGALVAFGIALALLVLVQFPFMAWSTGDMHASGGGLGTFDAQLNYTMWAGQSSGGPGDGVSESSSYWDNDTTVDGEDMAGLWFLRLGGPVILLGGALAIAAAIVTMLDKRGLANGLGWGSFSVAATGVVLFVIGIYQHQEQVKDQLTGGAPAGASFTLDFAWGLSFYIAIGAVLVIAVATYLATLQPRPQPARPPMSRRAP